MTAFDIVIIGHGLAGAAVAWQASWLGCSILVIDRNQMQTASRIAAGLITPITGPRFTQLQAFDDYFAHATAFYRRVEAATRKSHFSVAPAIRLFVNEEERAFFERKRSPSKQTTIQSPEVNLDRNSFKFEFGGFRMAPAAQLDAQGYLESSQKWLESSGRFIAGEINPLSGIEVSEIGVHLPRFGIEAKALVLCCGVDPLARHWLPHLSFVPAKGEILTLRIPELLEEQVVHKGIWLAPRSASHFVAGSTHDWVDLTSIPTSRGKQSLINGLVEMLKLPFEVVDHVAGVRPALVGSQPRFGVLREHSRIFYLNGLGSKGVLTAPLLANELVSLISTNSQIKKSGSRG